MHDGGEEGTHVSLWREGHNLARHAGVVCAPAMESTERVYNDGGGAETYELLADSLETLLILRGEVRGLAERVASVEARPTWPGPGAAASGQPRAKTRVIRKRRDDGIDENLRTAGQLSVVRNSGSRLLGSNILPGVARADDTATRGIHG